MMDAIKWTAPEPTSIDEIDWPPHVSWLFAPTVVRAHVGKTIRRTHRTNQRNDDAKRIRFVEVCAYQDLNLVPRGVDHRLHAYGAKVEVVRGEHCGRQGRVVSMGASVEEVLLQDGRIVLVSCNDLQELM